MENDEEIIKLIDHDIKIDISTLPKLLKNIIHELEEYDRLNNWVMYSGVVEGLEAAAKQCMVDEIITKSQYNKILQKYRRYM